MLSNTSILDKFTSFDLYRKIPKQYLQPSFLGALCKKYFIKI